MPLVPEGTRVGTDCEAPNCSKTCQPAVSVSKPLKKKGGASARATDSAPRVRAIVASTTAAASPAFRDERRLFAAQPAGRAGTPRARGLPSRATSGAVLPVV